jgi:hypothetical protein
MADSKHRPLRFDFTMGDVTYHIIQMPTRVRTNVEVAATLEITGPGGSFDRGLETTYQYLVTVTQGGRTMPLESWTQTQFLSMATGIAEQIVHLRRKNKEEKE